MYHCTAIHPINLANCQRSRRKHRAPLFLFFPQAPETELRSANERSRWLELGAGAMKEGLLDVGGALKYE